MATASTGTFCINTATSKIHNLVSGDKALKVLVQSSATPTKISALDGTKAVTGIVFALPEASGEERWQLTHGPVPAGGGTALWSGKGGYATIGDPAVSDYYLSSGDITATAATPASSAGIGSEFIKNGSAQKFVLAICDAAYRAYTSGVDQGSGLDSLTVTRGDLSLSNTSINDGTGIVNTYTRSYTMNFKFYQSGTINASGALDAANPDIANDGSDGVPF